MPMNILQPEGLWSEVVGSRPTGCVRNLKEKDLPVMYMQSTGIS
jgi:hypothetical protein